MNFVESLPLDRLHQVETQKMKFYGTKFPRDTYSNRYAYGYKQTRARFRPEVARTPQVQAPAPGKFEGEPSYAPYFWALALDGRADKEEAAFTFIVRSEDAELFPELTIGDRVFLVRSLDGFIHSKRVS